MIADDITHGVNCVSNTMCNKALNTVFNIQCMQLVHPTYQRMMKASAANIGIHSPMKLAELLNVAPARFTNWKTRGIPENMYLDVAQTVQCNPYWLRTGEGDEKLLMAPAAAGFTYSKPNSPEVKVLKLMENMDEATKYKLVKIGDTLIEPESNGGSVPAAGGQ